MNPAFFEHRAHDAFLFFRQRHQEVQRIHHLAFTFLGNGLRLLQGLLGFLGQLI
jgi:hypothetical protein